MLRRTRTTRAFVGLTVVGLSLVVTPEIARIVRLAWDDPAGRSSISPRDLDPMRAQGTAATLASEQETAIKNVLISDLIAGRRTLDEVTDDFMIIVENRTVELTAIRSQSEGATDREKVARTVIRIASFQPGASDEAMARVETEFRALFPHTRSVLASNATATIAKGAGPRARGIPLQTSKLIP
jgi:hypothetical protein